MNTLEALYFPGTTIYSASQFPLFLFFDTVHLLRPVEAADDDETKADIFISTGRCQEYTPQPLGKDRERFLRLVDDIRERKDDYAAQLSNLTLASLSQQKSSIDDTSRGIVASLLGAHGVQAVDEEQPDDSLWQARLVLKIAEILDAEEEEVAIQLALLDDQQDSLFQELKGELSVDEESLLDELEQLQKMVNRPSTGSVKNRLMAWARLHRAVSEPANSLWLTHLSEAADMLLEYYEKAQQSPPPVLASFVLPANLGWSRSEAANSMSQFTLDTRDIRSRIAKAIDAYDKATLTELAAEWQRLIDASFSATTYGRSVLNIYDFSAAPCSSLLDDNSTTGELLAVIFPQ